MPWQRFRYRTNKVWVEVGEDGLPLRDARGLFAMRYKPEDERTYSIRPAEIRTLDDKPAFPAAARPPEQAAARDVGKRTIEVHTDGSALGNPGPAGVGVVLLWGRARKEISLGIGIGTNNQAELRAILVGLEAVKRPELEVVVYSDSAYAIGVLSEGWKAKQNRQLVAEVQRAMGRFESLRFVKVRGHAGEPENERADALARAGAASRLPEEGPRPA